MAVCTCSLMVYNGRAERDPPVGTFRPEGGPMLIHFKRTAITNRKGQQQVTESRSDLGIRQDEQTDEAFQKANHDNNV